MTRQKKTPRQRAEEALAVAERKVARLTTERDKHRAALTATTHELDAATTRCDYLSQHPDLPPAKGINVPPTITATTGAATITKETRTR